MTTTRARFARSPMIAEMLAATMIARIFDTRISSRRSNSIETCIRAFALAAARTHRRFHFIDRKRLIKFLRRRRRQLACSTNAFSVVVEALDYNSKHAFRLYHF